MAIWKDAVVYLKCTNIIAFYQQFKKRTNCFLLWQRNSDLFCWKSKICNCSVPSTTQHFRPVARPAKLKLKVKSKQQWLHHLHQGQWITLIINLNITQKLTFLIANIVPCNQKNTEDNNVAVIVNKNKLKAGLQCYQTSVSNNTERNK